LQQAWPSIPTASRLPGSGFFATALVDRDF
jgi:hypothetical protein